MKNNQKKRTWIQSVFMMMLSIMMVWTLIPGLFSFDTAYADVGQEPAHEKTIENNGDGTYKLELSVTGDADTEVETAADVNVIVVYDVSNSMTSDAGTSRYSRADQAEDVVHDFITNLRSYQNTSDPSNIQMALVTFARTASIRQTGGQNWTSDLSDNSGINRFFDNGGTDGTVNLTYTGNASFGTNWQSAMTSAYQLVQSADDDPTFVIFVTDGAPTASGNGNNAINPNSSLSQLRPFYEAGLPNARNIQTAEDTTMFGIYAYGTEADLLDDLMYYANTGSERTISADTVPTDNYYNAGDTDALNAAIEEIFQTIVEALGVSSAAISDGTTNQVEASTGDIAELLEVDEESYQYWLDIPVVNNQFQRIDLVTGDTVTYTVRDNGDDTCTVTWGGKSVTVDGSVKSGHFKYEWKEANDLYNYAPPDAEFTGGAVNWDLSSVGTLLDGVTYSVTFDVYPSQTTYDLIAGLKNGDLDYNNDDDIDPKIRTYLKKTGDSSYSLLTNTEAVLSWDDTRDDAGTQTASYNELDPVATDAETLTAVKEWEGGEADVDEMEMTVLMDDEPFHTSTLKESEGWETTSFISIGIIKKGRVLPGAEGHDFKFAELDDTQYHWELETPTVHPMLIDGVKTMLVMVDDKHPAQGEIIEINGKEYYIDEDAAGLTAVNHRRSNLNIRKDVTGEDAPEDATFPFTFTIDNSKAPDSEPTDDPDHNSDYWLWFSIYDTKAGETVMDADVDGATGPASDGYYYAPNNTPITVQMKDGWNLRFINLPTGTEYTIEEGELATGFVFVSAKKTAGEGAFDGGQTSTGSIDSTKTAYQVVYTNDYALTDLEITKVWEDADNQDGLRPTAEEFADLLTLSPEPEDGATPVVVDNEDGTYTITYTGLPKYDSDKQEIEYEVTEGTIEGYDTEGSPAKDHETITNTHEPEVISIPVTKEWTDFSAKSRPESITVILKADNETVQTVEITPDDDGNWTYEFTDLPKCKDGEDITYTIDENPVPANYELEGITGDAEQGFTITNTYDFDPASITFGGEKIVSGYPDGAPSVTFTFTLEGEGESQTKTVTSNQTDKSFTFDELEYDEPGEYTYTVTEKQDGGPGWTYDSSSYTVVVTVVDDENGTLVASKEIKLGDDTVDEISFENSYEAGPAEVDLSGVKTLTGRELKEGEFTFELYDEKNELVQSKTNDANGDYVFDTLEFDEVGTYKYTIKEKDTKLGGVTYDTKVYKVTVTVSDDGSGTLSAEISGDVNSDGSGADFTNSYKADPTKIKFSGSKSISGYPETADPVTFTFTLSGDASATQTVTGEGDFTFDWVKLDEEKTYTFTIAETEGGTEGWTNDTTTYTITAEVTDNGEGQLVPTVSGEGVTVKVSEDGTQAEVSEVNFLNKYQAEPDTLSIIGKKIIDDFKGVLPADTFTFQISGTGEVVAEENSNEETPANPSEEAVEEPAEEAAEEAAPAASDNETADKEAVEKTDEAPAENADASKAEEAPTENADAAKAEEAQKEAEAKVEAAEEKLEAAEAAEEKAEAAQKAAEEKAEEAKDAVEEAKADEDADAEAAKTEADKAKDAVEEAKDAVDEAKDAVEKAEAEVKEAKAEAEKAEAEVKEAKAEAEKAEATEAKTEAEKTGSADEDSAVAAKAAETAAEAAEAVVETGVEAATETITAPVPAGGDTAKNDADGFVKFEDIEFTRAGTYTYTIEEIAGSMPGVTNDTSKKKVVVEVKDDGSGKLKAEITSPKGEFQFEFHNKYDTPPTPSKVTDTIPVTKELAGHSLAKGDFTFELVCPDGKVITAKNDADGNVEFPAYTFTKEGTYKFTVREKKGKNSTITYDEAEYTVTANVKNNYDGKKLEVTWVLGEEGETEIVFNNKYKDVVYIDPPVKKVVEGNPKKTETYTFLLEANDEENPMPKAADGESSMEMSIKGAGEKEFGKIAFTEPGAYSYTVTEVEGDNPDCEYDDSVYTVIATVTEDSNYKLHVKCDYRKNGKSINVAKFIFTNTYEEEPGKKVKTGDDNNLIGWLAVMAIAGVAGGTILYRRRREDD